MCVFVLVFTHQFISHITRSSFHAHQVSQCFIFIDPHSLANSFPDGNCFILYFIPPWQLFHVLFHSLWHLFQWHFHSFMAATSFSLEFCLILPWQCFHAIFHSFWHLFFSTKLSFLEVFTFPGIIHMESTWNPWNPCGIPCGIHGINVG